MIDIKFSDRIKAAAPGLKVLQIEADVVNEPTSDALWQEIISAGVDIKRTFALPDINKRPGIRATREAYKALGKEPNRYRPSAEALCRRIVNDKGLYRLTTLIDVINLVSILSGYSIGGFDRDKIDGNLLVLDAGERGEEFNAIGRGLLNIEGLPVLRDKTGGIGTPTSDEERTKLTPETTHLLMLVNMYGEEMSADDTVELVKRLLSTHARLTSFSYTLLIP